MAEVRLIDANALLKSYDVAWMVEYDETGCGVRKKAIPTKTIDDAQTIDAVEVVRCRECKKSTDSLMLNEGWKFCTEWRRATRCDGFCHYGKKLDATDNNVGRKDGGAE